MAKGRKTGGRKAGTPNKATKVSREIISKITSDMYEKILLDIEALDPLERVKVWIKLCEFCISKPQTIALDMTVDGKRTIEDKLSDLAAEDGDENEED